MPLFDTVTAYLCHSGEECGAEMWGMTLTCADPDLYCMSDGCCGGCIYRRGGLGERCGFEIGEAMCVVPGRLLRSAPFAVADKPPSFFAVRSSFRPHNGRVPLLPSTAVPEPPPLLPLNAAYMYPLGPGVCRGVPTPFLVSWPTCHGLTRFPTLPFRSLPLQAVRLWPRVPV